MDFQSVAFNPRLSAPSMGKNLDSADRIDFPADGADEDAL
jgi:hypothetical protein